MRRGRGHDEGLAAAGSAPVSEPPTPVPGARAGGPLPDLVLATGWMTQVINLAIVVAAGEWGEIPWIISTIVLLAAATLVRRKRGHLVLSAWFAVMAGGTAWGQLLDVSLSPLDAIGAAPWVLATTNLAADSWLALTLVASVHLFTVFPDGVVRRPRERWATRGSWALLAVPVVVALATPIVPVPWYVDIGPTPNPHHVLPFALGGQLGQTVLGSLDAAVLVAWVLLALRYRLLDQHARRQVRWLLVPVVVATIGFALNLAVRDTVPGLVNLVFVGLPAMTGSAIAVALSWPEGLDVDRVLRRSLVYGVLWVTIAGVYGAAAAAVGFAAGRRLSVGSAVLLTVVATLAFQPARTRLESVADRWVFGARSDRARVIARLGATLADTYDLHTLLPRMAETVEQGLGLAWAQVHLDGLASATSHDDPPPTPTVLAVPIVLDGDQLGVVECGPRTDGDLTDEDRVVVETLARQAALAVRNVRLTTELAAQAEQLAASRARLVRAQEAERRRIERNIHDGVQQELVALIGQAGLLGRSLDRDPNAVAEELRHLRDGLRRVLTDLRELAAGIHPSLLDDRGLLAAVESLAARNPVPVTVRADPSLRALRTSQEVEGAGYFTVAEALANSLKHAEASAIEVTLSRADGSLKITVHDDGRGFVVSGAGSDGAPKVDGQGLANLAERVSALGGQFRVVGGVDAGTTVTAVLPVGDA